MVTDFSRLKREQLPMPPFIRDALVESGLMGDYRQRPAYQQNDYIAWITNAKRNETRNRRLTRMLSELATGGVYMKMKHPASTKIPRHGK